MVFSGGHAWFFPGGMRRIRRDTVNEREIRILLECILVKNISKLIFGTSTKNINRDWTVLNI